MIKKRNDYLCSLLFFRRHCEQRMEDILQKLLVPKSCKLAIIARRQARSAKTVYRPLRARPERYYVFKQTRLDRLIHQRCRQIYIVIVWLPKARWNDEELKALVRRIWPALQIRECKLADAHEPPAARGAQLKCEEKFEHRDLLRLAAVTRNHCSHERVELGLNPVVEFQ